MSIAWRAILVACLAAGEEATLASLTGLFQREPERAAALVATARTRAINQSRHSEGHVVTRIFLRRTRFFFIALGGPTTSYYLVVSATLSPRSLDDA